VKGGPHFTSSGHLYPFDELTQTSDRIEAESYGMNMSGESLMDSSATWDDISEVVEDSCGED
jgi:hypothetical protein